MFLEQTDDKHEIHLEVRTDHISEADRGVVSQSYKQRAPTLRTNALHHAASSCVLEVQTSGVIQYRAFCGVLQAQFSIKRSLAFVGYVLTPPTLL
jgi:hypothetical protein